MAIANPLSNMKNCRRVERIAQKVYWVLGCTNLSDDAFKRLLGGMIGCRSVPEVYAVAHPLSGEARAAH